MCVNYFGVMALIIPFNVMFVELTHWLLVYIPAHTFYFPHH